MTTLLEENGVQIPFHLPRVTLEEFAEFCQRNPDIQAERTAEGALVLMCPAESEGDSRNVEITTELSLRNRRQPTPGRTFGPSAGFTLPDTAVLSPDAAWISHERWNALTAEQQRGWAQVCPDFVVELMSPTDRLKSAQEKMRCWIGYSAQLGWLIHREKRMVYIYRPNQATVTLNNPAELRGDPELPGFVLPMKLVF